MSIQGGAKEARCSLNDKRGRFGALWAAFEHYGDPGPRNTLAAHR